VRILYLAPFLPHPPDKGERIRAFQHVQHLAREHEIHLVCLSRGVPRAEDLSKLETLCASVRTFEEHRALSRLRAGLAFIAGASFSIAALRSPRLERAIASDLRSGRYDLVLVFSSIMADSVRGVSGAPRVVDFVELDSELWRSIARRRRFPTRWVYRQEANRLARHELQIYGDSALSLFVSDVEADLLRERRSGGTIAVIPNGVDLEYFTPRAEPPDRSPLAVFTGTMDYEPNIDAMRYFCRDILPRIRSRIPDFTFRIVGRRPARSVRRLGRRPEVTVTGEVPDVRPHLNEARVAVAPLRLGRGVQNKVLEAMASGVPVVGTTLALQGLAAKDVRGFRVADRPDTFASEILALVSDRAWARRCSLEARQFVERHHRWDDHNRTLSRLLEASALRPTVAETPG
jgi:sugar transferase (PEP-CTERM/EpsH1 system associated)